MFHAGQQIGPYTLVRKLGRGGFGEVWLAGKRSHLLTKRVAVKLPNNNEIDLDAIRQEAALGERASGHINILPIIDADIYDGQVVIVSEYADGGSLGGLLKGEGPFESLKTEGELILVGAEKNAKGEDVRKYRLSIEKAVEMTIGILKGLEYLHSQVPPIIHRDLKPDNILLQGDTPRIADFGISRLLQDTSHSETLAGTWWYMSPEAFDKKRNQKTDIWAVGVILYQTLKGELPFPQTEKAALWKAITMLEPEPFPVFIPGALQQIVWNALAKQPDRRYQTAFMMRQDLQKFLRGSYVIVNQAEVPTERDDAPSPVSDELTLIPYRKGSRWGFCDRHRRITVQPKYDDVHFFNKEIACVKLNDKYGFIDKHGKEITPFKYEFATSDRDGIARVVFNERAGFIDQTGKEIIPPKYDMKSAYTFSEGLVCMSRGGKCEFFDKHGELVIPSKYEEGGYFYEGLAHVKFKSKYGFINRLGEEVIPFKYDGASSFSEGLAAVHREGLFKGWGFINKKNNEIVPHQYSSVHSFSEGLAWVFHSFDCSFINQAGKEIIPFKSYDTVYYFKEGLAGVVVYFKEGKPMCGFIDESGYVVIEFKYEFNGVSTSFYEGLACMNLNGRFGFVDTTGYGICWRELPRFPTLRQLCR